VSASVAAARAKRSWSSGDLSAIWSSPLLRGLSRQTQAEFLNLGQPIQAERDTPLIRADDDRAVLLLAGIAVADVTGRDGTSVVLGLLGPGEVVGLPVVLGEPSAGTGAICLTSVEALSFRGTVLRGYLAGHPFFATACLRLINKDLAAARHDLARQTGTLTIERVADRLVQLADRWGQPENGEIVIPVPLTQDMLASWARASRESTAKALHELRKSGVIRTGRRELTILDLARLEARCRQPQPHACEVLRALLGSLD
jgi:CRP/FNR family transcriptional regulator, cyclic AMP receptor protein